MKEYIITLETIKITAPLNNEGTLNPISPGGGGYFVPGAWFFLHNF